MKKQQAGVTIQQKNFFAQQAYNYGIIAESYITVLGAKGKFSGGFDINAFGDIQEGKGTFKYGNLVMLKQLSLFIY